MDRNISGLRRIIATSDPQTLSMISQSCLAGWLGEHYRSETFKKAVATLEADGTLKRGYMYYPGTADEIVFEPTETAEAIALGLFIHPDSGVVISLDHPRLHPYWVGSAQTPVPEQGDVSVSAGHDHLDMSNSDRHTVTAPYVVSGKSARLLAEAATRFAADLDAAAAAALAAGDEDAASDHLNDACAVKSLAEALHAAGWGERQEVPLIPQKQVADPTAPRR